MRQQLFADVNEDFCVIELVKTRFEEWSSLSSETFKNAYVIFSLPLIFKPLILFEIFDWNPLEVIFLDLQLIVSYTKLKFK